MFHISQLRLETGSGRSRIEHMQGADLTRRHPHYQAGVFHLKYNYTFPRAN
jgi:hypothetical protein